MTARRLVESERSRRSGRMLAVGGVGWVLTAGEGEAEGEGEQQNVPET